MKQLGFTALLGVALFATPLLAEDNILIDQANGINAQLTATCTGGGISGPPKTCTLTTQEATTTTGGGTFGKVLSAATTNSTNIKATGGNLYSINALNTNAAIAYLKFYDKATAPTCNSDAVVATFALPQNIRLSTTFDKGVVFAAGIGLCITAGQADNDNAAATTGITTTVSYK